MYITLKKSFSPRVKTLDIKTSKVFLKVFPIAKITMGRLSYNIMDSISLSRCLVNSPYSINECYLTDRSARASDSSARQPRPPYNLLVSLSCFRRHVYITLPSVKRAIAISSTRVVIFDITRLAILLGYIVTFRGTDAT